jgi:predicted secreted protein
MKKVIFNLSVLLIALLCACTKPYNPQVVATNANALVVEGLINTGTDSTYIKLSRTVEVNSTTTTNPEKKAIVTVENAQGTVYPLTEISPGTYSALPLNLNNTTQYRVRIKTSNGKTYLSALVTPKVAPPIDSVGFKILANGIQLYVNAHDATNNTRYYKFTYQETWQFHALYSTNYITTGKAIVPRPQNQLVYSCFGTDYSTNTIVNSTAALSQDVVYQFPVTTVNQTSEKIETKYSIQVTEVALTKDAYQFWDNLKTNTESLGSIFDAQPSEIAGNINNVADPSEPVIGYIGAGVPQKKRVFISNAQLPHIWQPTYPYICSLDTAFGCNPHTPPPTPCFNDTLINLIPLTKAHLYSITDPFFQFTNSSIISMKPLGYLYTDPLCADCTLRGSKTTPSYWK